MFVFCKQVGGLGEERGMKLEITKNTDHIHNSRKTNAIESFQLLIKC